MKIDSKLIVKKRKEKFWTQEELAVTAGLNLRTIQRIEKEGVVSLQSKKALASAFDIDPSDLDFKEEKIMKKYEFKVLKFDVKGWFGGKVDSTDIETQLNQFGAEGWDLLHTSEILKDMGVTAMLVIIMRRPLD